MSHRTPATKADDLKPLMLLEDEPVENWKQDELGLLNFSRIIASAALGTRGPFTIGVYGAWGEGKTSVLRQARSLLKRKSGDTENIVTVWFNAWQYEHEEHPIIPLVASIIDQIDKQLRESESLETQEWKSVKQGFAKTRDALRGILYGVSLKGFSVKDAIDRYEALQQTGPAPLPDRSLYYDAYAALSQAVPVDVRKGPLNKMPRIVIFIDDLDRCMAEKAVRLLESIKLVLTQPGFIYVLAIYEPIVHEFIENQNLDVPENLRSGIRYLDKIVQLPLNIPKHNARFEKYVEQILKRDSEFARAHHELCSIISEFSDAIAEGVKHNPRSFVRLVNNLIIAREFYLAQNPEAANDENVFGLFVVSYILRAQLPSDQFELLVGSQQICSRLANTNAVETLLFEREQSSSPAGGRYKYPPHRERVAEGLFQSLDQARHLFDLLKSGPGRRWLSDEALRNDVVNLALVTRETESEPEAQTEEEIIDRAIRRSLRLDSDTAITDKQRSLVTKLHLNGSKLTDGGLEYLVGCSSLTELFVGDTQVTDAGLKRLAGLSSLKILNLAGTKLTDQGLAFLSRLSSLSELDLTGTQVTDAGLKRLGGLASLTILNLQDTAITDQGLGPLTDIKSLRVLGFEDTAVGNSGLRTLANDTLLNALWLGGTHITDEGLKHLEHLKSLQRLTLDRTDIGDAGLEHVGHLSSLHALNLSKTKISDNGLRHLCELAMLERLYLDETQVTDVGLGYLKSLKALEVLTLRETRITDACIEHVRAIESLKALIVHEKQLTDEGVAELQAALPACEIQVYRSYSGVLFGGKHNIGSP